MVDELLWNVLRGKNSKKSWKLVWIFMRRTVHCSSTNIGPYGEYLFAISIDVYRELSEYPYYYQIHTYSFSINGNLPI